MHTSGELFVTGTERLQNDNGTPREHASKRRLLQPSLEEQHRQRDRPCPDVREVTVRVEAAPLSLAEATQFRLLIFGGVGSNRVGHSQRAGKGL